MSAVEVVRVRCHGCQRIGLCYRDGEAFTLLPCDCNANTEVLEVVAAILADCKAAGGCVFDNIDDCLATSCNAGSDSTTSSDVPVCSDCGTAWVPVRRGECVRCWSNHRPATPPADDANRAPVSGGLDEGGREAVDDGPECDNCGKTTCPDADLPEFSEPRECEFASLYEAFRASKDCDYGCGRDYSMQAVRLWLAPEMERILAARAKAAGAERDTARREAGERIAQAVRDAADEVHRESRWSLEQAMQGKPQDAVDRLLVLEKVLRDRADALTSNDGCGAVTGC